MRFTLGHSDCSTIFRSLLSPDFFELFFLWGNLGIKAHASLLQIGSALSVSRVNEFLQRAQTVYLVVWVTWVRRVICSLRLGGIKNLNVRLMQIYTGALRLQYHLPIAVIPEFLRTISLMGKSGDKGARFASPDWFCTLRFTCK